jgi:hypothetical protein
LAVVALATAQSASAASSLTLDGSGQWKLTTLDSAGICPGNAFIDRRGKFTVSGTATGSYPGTFTESGKLGISGTGGPYGTFGGYFNAQFSIASGSTTITGSLSQSGVTVGHCAMWGPDYRLFNAPVAYKAVVNTPGQPQRTCQGAAGWPQTGTLVNGTFQSAAPWQVSISEQFAFGCRPGNGPAPIVATVGAANVGLDAATVIGTVETGEAATYHFDYGTSTNYTSHTISEPITAAAGTEVDARLTGLSPNTVYHYRIEATNTFWGTTSYGADETFTTT